jgi:predicted lipid-binding transport protein (Tim44 family)
VPTQQYLQASGHCDRRARDGCCGAQAPAAPAAAPPAPAEPAPNAAEPAPAAAAPAEAAKEAAPAAPAEAAKEAAPADKGADGAAEATKPRSAVNEELLCAFKYFDRSGARPAAAH